MILKKNNTVSQTDPNRRVAIVKVRNNDYGAACRVKYRFNDLLKFTNHVNKKWSGWKYYEVSTAKKMIKQ